MTRLFDSFGLKQTIFKATRPGCDDSNGGTCVDNVFTNINSDKYYADVIHTIMSDHDAIILTSSFNVINCSTKNIKPVLNIIRPVNTISISYYIYLLSQIKWFEVYKTINVNDKVNVFMSLLLEAIDTAFPLTLVKSRHDKRPVNCKWYTSELRNMKKGMFILLRSLFSSWYCTG